MTAADASLIAALPGWAYAFVLVLARVSAAIMVLPGLGEAELPAMMRAGLAAALTVLLLPGLAPLLPPAPNEVWRGVAMIAAELLTGLWFGWLARLVVLSLSVAGQIMSYMVGLSNVLQTDMTGAQVPALSRLLGLVATVAVLVSGLYAVPLAALAGSFHVIPAGTLLPVGDAANSIVDGVGQCFAIALRLAAPLIVADVAFHLSLGLLARLAPQLHLFFVSMPAQILGGLALLAAVLSALLGTWEEATRSIYTNLPGLR